MKTSKSYLIKYIGLIIVIFFKNSILFSQDPPDAPNYSNATPQSSSAASAAKGISVPVNYFTGIPQTTIPFYQYGGKNLNLNVGLSYSAGGIRVEQESTSVGSGWNLLAGGVIARTVKGIPDDFSPGGFLTTTTSVYSASNSDLEQGIVDGMNDEFQFNFNGMSGSFYLGKGTRVYDGSNIQNYLFIPETKYQLITTYGTVNNVTYNGIKSFTIITEDGTQYIFDACELANQINPDHETWQTGDPPYYYHYYVSSWYLSKIIAPQNTAEITIEYISYQSDLFYELPQTSSRYASNNIEVKPYIRQYAFLERKLQRIKKINLPDNAFIDFVYNTNIRCDDQADISLKQLLLKKPDGSVIKGIRLDQVYSTPTGFSTTDICSQIPYSYDWEKRMFLKKITEFSSSAELPPYIFEYENTVFLPDRKNKDQDLYGFYNGANNSRLVIASNRTTNFTYAKAGSLKKITYPTGAYTAFQYEANTQCSYYRELSWTSLSQYYTQTINLNQLHTQTFKFFAKLSPNDPNYISDYDPSGTSNLKVEFRNLSTNSLITTLTFNFGNDIDLGEVKELVLPNGSYSITSWIERGPNYPSNYTGPDIPENTPLDLEWDNDNVLSNGNTIIGGLRIRQIKTGDGLNSANDKLKTFKYNLSNGYSSGYSPEHAVMNYRFTSVKEIRDCFICGWYNSNVDYYIYSSAINNTLTFPQGSPVGYSKVEIFDGDENNFISRTVFDFSSFADLPGYNYPGLQYYYDQTNQFPFPENKKPEYLFGLPKSINIYSNTGTLKKKTNNVYTPYISNNYTGDFYSLKVGVYKRYVDRHGNLTKYYISKSVQLPTGMARLMETTENTFFDDGSSLTNNTTYTYDNVKNVLRSVTSNYGAKKQYQKIQKRFYYPFDYSVGNVMNNITNFPYKYGYYYSPIGTETWLLQGSAQDELDGNPFAPLKLTDATMTEFDNYNNLILPTKSYKYLNNAPASLTYSSYQPPFTQLVRDANLIKPVNQLNLYNNSAQNIQATALISGISNSQIIDEATGSLLATAKNAKFNEIAYSGFEVAEKGNLTYSNSGIVTAPDAFTGKSYYSLPAGNITSASALPAGKNYIISFYAKSGCTVNGQLLKSELNTAIGWTFYEYKISNGGALTISGTGYIDELKVYPEGANMTSYTYEPFVGLKAVCGLNSIVKYEYDSFGRLILERDKDNNIIKTHEYGIRQQ